MARSRSSFLLLVPLLLVVSPSLAISDGPFIVAHKKVSLARQKSGMERVSVSQENNPEPFSAIVKQEANWTPKSSTSRTAYDVTLNDDSWGHDRFDIISGSTSETWERLDAGATVSHSFVLDSQVKGLFHGSPAVIKFRIPTKAALQEAFSTPIQPLDILADQPAGKKFEWAKRLLAKYGSLVSVLGFIGMFVYMVASPSKSSGGKGSKKKR
ncbi:uncharacterized protein LOC109823517 [Asparagus officinalis]|uniref:uncharacterized protein LOC109823517 n=1 Tax=Asparagus officinalis TaxID=4686 RepID=UPI00098E0BA1|nr:uncharacterized protein LOC109823517 [Asparagus officinalis]